MNVTKSKLFKLIISLVIFSLIVVWLVVIGPSCKTDGSNVCYDDKSNAFKIEEKAHLKIAVESEETKDKLLEIWAVNYPNNNLEVDVVEAMTRVELSETIEYDILYVDGQEAPFFMAKFANLGQKAQSIVTNNIPKGLQDSFNVNGLRFTPQNVTGKPLYLNMTLLKEIGLSREDVASFESIKANQDTILEFLDITFPFSLKDQGTLYPFLTARGWTLNFKHEGMNPDIDSPEFLEGLAFIEFLSQMKLNNNEEKDLAMDLEYNFESKFFERESLFGYITDYELAQLYQAETGDEWLAVPFPTYQETHLAPVVNVNGYVVNVNTLYPSASAEVLRILRGVEFVDLGLSSYSPIMTGDEILDTLEPSLVDTIEAFGHGDLMTILALDDNPRVKSSTLYDQVDFVDVIAQLYDASITKEEAQEKLVESSIQWIKDNVPEDEEVAE